MTQRKLAETTANPRSPRWWKQDWFTQGVILALIAAIFGAVFTAAAGWLLPPQSTIEEDVNLGADHTVHESSDADIVVDTKLDRLTYPQTHSTEKGRDVVDSALMVPTWANKAWVGSLHGSQIDLRLSEDHIGKTTIIEIKGLPNDPSEIRIKGIDLFYHIIEGQLVCTANNYLNSWVKLEMIDNNRIQLTAYSDAEFTSPLWHVVLHEADVASNH